MNIAAAFEPSMPGISPGIYDNDDFTAISEIAHREAGLVLPPGKAMLVYSRLAPWCGIRAAPRSAPMSCASARTTRNGRARSAPSPPTTFFYREAHHFEHFAQELRPDFVKRLERGGKLRIWSAGCSSGEETWSLLMTLLGPERTPGWRSPSATCGCCPATSRSTRCTRPVPPATARRI
jgi:chemotaxis protein methyltransferase CheR